MQQVTVLVLIFILLNSERVQAYSCRSLFTEPLSPVQSHSVGKSVRRLQNLLSSVREQSNADFELTRSEFVQTVEAIRPVMTRVQESALVEDYNLVLLRSMFAKMERESWFSRSDALLSVEQVLNHLVLDVQPSKLQTAAYMAGVHAGVRSRDYFIEALPRVKSPLQFSALLLVTYYGMVNDDEISDLAIAVQSPLQLTAFQVGFQSRNFCRKYFRSATQIKNSIQLQAFKMAAQAGLTSSFYFSDIALRVSSEAQLAVIRQLIRLGRVSREDFKSALPLL